MSRLIERSKGYRWILISRGGFINKWTLYQQELALKFEDKGLLKGRGFTTAHKEQDFFLEKLLIFSETKCMDKVVLVCTLSIGIPTILPSGHFSKKNSTHFS